MMVRFKVTHPHIHKQRARVLRSGRSYTPKETVQAEDEIRDSFRRNAGRYGALLVGALEIDIRAEIKISKSRRDLHDAQPHTQKPDCDNIAKLVMDALNGVAYKDDSQIFKVNVSKRWTTKWTSLTIEIKEYE